MYIEEAHRLSARAEAYRRHRTMLNILSALTFLFFLTVVRRLRGRRLEEVCSSYKNSLIFEGKSAL